MASPELLKHYIKTLQTKLRGTFTRAAMEKIWPDLLREPDKAIEDACDYFILHSSFLPSPDIFLKKVQILGREIRMREAKRNEDEWNAQKPRRDEPTFLSQEQRTEYGQMSVKIMFMATPSDEFGNPRKPTLDEYNKLTEACRIMADGFPSAAREWCELGQTFQEAVRALL